MGIFSSKQFDSFDTLFVDQLQDIYDAEQRIAIGLPKMADAASAHELKELFLQHLEETRHQIRRLEEVFELVGETAQAKECPAMKGLIEEGQEAINAEGDPMVLDAALIAAAQRIEHYEMAAYGTARTFARFLQQDRAASVLQEILEEEKHADQRLTELAEGFINAAASHARS